MSWNKGNYHNNMHGATIKKKLFLYQHPEDGQTAGCNMLVNAL
jgi:hypothetical protein